MKLPPTPRRVWPWLLALLICSLTANLILVGKLRIQLSPAGDNAGPAATTPPPAASEDTPAVGEDNAGALVGDPTQPRTQRGTVAPTARAQTILSPGPPGAVPKTAAPAAGAQAQGALASRQSVPQAGGAMPNARGESAPSGATPNSFASTGPQSAVAGLPSYAGSGRASLGEGGTGTGPGDASQVGTRPPLASTTAGQNAGLPPADSTAAPDSAPPGGGSKAAGGSAYEQSVSRAAEVIYDALVKPNLGAEPTPVEAATQVRPTAATSLRAWVGTERVRRVWSTEARSWRRTAIAEANRPAPDR